MTIEIKDGKFTITGELQKPVRSKSGKTFIVATTNGFTTATNDKGKEYSISVNIITRDDK